MNTLFGSISLSTLVHVSVVVTALWGVGVTLEPEPIATHGVETRPVTFQTIVLPEDLRPELAQSVEDGTDEVAPDEEIALGTPDAPEPPPEKRVEPKPRVKKTKKPTEPKKPEEPAEPEVAEKAPPAAPEVAPLAPIVATSDASPATTHEATAQEPEPTRDAAPILASTVGTTPKGSSSSPDADSGAATRGKTVRTGKGGQGLGGGVDRKGLLKGYRKAVFKQLNKHKHYPRLAKRARLTGTVVLRIRIDSKGRIVSSRVLRSSNHKTLDDGALETVRRMGSLPVPPADLGWTTRDLDIPIKYSIR